MRSLGEGMPLYAYVTHGAASHVSLVSSKINPDTLPLNPRPHPERINKVWRRCPRDNRGVFGL